MGLATLAILFAIPKHTDALVEPAKMERLFDLMVEAGKVAQELRDRREPPE